MSEGDVIPTDSSGVQTQATGIDGVINEDVLLRQQLVVWAKVSGHPFWPARYCDDDEKAHHARVRQRKNDILVRFFGAGDNGS
jgi:hypothetical protein